MAGAPGPRLESVRIRRVVVPGAEAALGLGDAIAAALVRELGAEGAAEPPPAGMAQTIAPVPSSTGRTLPGGTAMARAERRAPPCTPLSGRPE
jgi:hypothetical protein